MNLTAISVKRMRARLHFLDCAALLGMQDFAGSRVIDVGTGAGFPGLALKIACPDMQLTLLDSLDKRIGFLRGTCAKLGFDDVECVHARAEEIPDGYRQGFDFAVSRAVARLNLLCELCLPYVKRGGAFIAMKGPELDAELKEAANAIRLLGGSVEKRTDYRIPGTDIVHNAVIIRKVSDTPAKYPPPLGADKKRRLYKFTLNGVLQINAAHAFHLVFINFQQVLLKLLHGIEYMLRAYLNELFARAEAPVD